MSILTIVIIVSVIYMAIFLLLRLVSKNKHEYKPTDEQLARDVEEIRQKTVQYKETVIF